MEVFLIKVLVDLEYEGVKINFSFLEVYFEELVKDISVLEKEVYEMVGV